MNLWMKVREVIENVLFDYEIVREEVPNPGRNYSPTYTKWYIVRRDGSR